MQPAAFHVEPLLATAYAFLLLGIAAGLEWMGRHSHRRSHRFHTAGFRFHQQADDWECPEGARLVRAEIDNELRVIRYRAPAHTCNRCPIKERCTDSDGGREIEVALDPWLRSAVGRFHRGMSLALVVLAGLITAIELFRHDHGAERWALSTVLVAVALIGLRIVRDLRQPGNIGTDGSIHTRVVWDRHQRPQRGPLN
jgi:hypothetical protein